MISAVAAMGRKRELGSGNKLLWRIPDDLKRFRALTKGHPIIMGRKTYESIVGYAGAPLPERTNIIVTRQAGLTMSFAGVIVAKSLDEAIEVAKQKPGAEEIHIGGGAELYREALPRIDKLYLTLIDASSQEADAFFPPYAAEFTQKTFEEKREWNGLAYTWVNLER